jgi:hypothetical protein
MRNRKGTSEMRRTLYKIARLLGDTKAASSGKPDKIIKRLINKQIGKQIVSKLWWR